MRFLALVAAAALLAALAPAGQAQQQEFGHCGVVTLVFMNPDLRPREDGLVHASGTFFIQFQAIGDRASEVASISFAFGKDIPDGAVQCDTPVGPLTGAYLDGYRSDADPTDGFFVPVNTTLVPDDRYGAAVTAYDASGTYLARFFTRAVVENGAECRLAGVCQDRTEPWPIVLPGDGAQTSPDGGLTIEFAEPVAQVTVRINGQQVVPEPWVPPPRDDDAIPGNDADDCSAFGPLAELPPGPCHRTVWGSGFRVQAAPVDGDVIEVYAIDLAGNDATKVVTVGGATQGGTIELATPELQMTAEAVELETEAGQAASYRVRLLNVGQGEAEARLTVSAPDLVATEWDSPTVTIASGAEQTVTLTATPSKDTRPGSYTLLARATYKSGTDDLEKQLALGLKVSEFRPVPESPLRQARANATDEPLQPAEEPRRAPGPDPEALALMALAGAMAAARRRR